METLTLSQAQTELPQVIRRMLKTRQPVLVHTPAGLIQISPYDLAEEAPPASRGSLGKIVTTGELADWSEEALTGSARKLRTRTARR